MGNDQSRHNIPRANSHHYPPPPYQAPQSFATPPPASYAVPPQRGDAGSLTQQFARKYGYIADNFKTVEQVQTALREAGLESSNLIVGIDFTKSNEWTGKKTFRGRSLHHISDLPNPYEQAIGIIGRTLEAFDDDKLIPCYGFGDASTHDQHAFNFNSSQRPCNGFQEALRRYREVTPNIRLAGPTSFAPIIETAVRIVEESRGQYHILLIIADGQVTRSSDLNPGQLSPQEKATIDAIVAASNYPLSIVLVGVGDGPWESMRSFDDSIPKRNFDNFQFVNFSEIMSRHIPDPHKEAQFALAALMEIPFQFKACNELRLLGRQVGRIPPRKPLEPPPSVLEADRRAIPGSYSSVGTGAPPASYSSVAPSAPPYSSPYGNIPVPVSSGNDAGICPICFAEKKNMVFQCGHQTCADCGNSLSACPICRAPITQRIKVYD